MKNVTATVRNLLVTFFFLGTVQCVQAQPALLSYDCTPSSCLNFAGGVGFFSSGMTVVGSFDRGGGTTGSRTASVTLASNGCTVPVSINSLGYSIAATGLLGDSIVAEATGSQLGIDLLRAVRRRYYNGSTLTTEPPDTTTVGCI